MNYVVEGSGLVHSPHLFTVFRELSRESFAEPRDGIFPEIRENARMEPDVFEHRRNVLAATLKALIDDGRFRSLRAWCTAAGVGWSSVNDVLIGKTRAMGDENYQKLADAARIPVWELKGEEPPPIGLPDREQRALAALRRLNAAQQEAEVQALEAKARVLAPRAEKPEPPTAQ